jgi:hypothetical protein
MSALVAYYLSDLAPPQNRKRTINTKDLETYFKIADFPLPDFRFTLNNAKAAGYFDAVGEGEYKLNAVGHNLVVHSLPRVNGRTTTKKKRHVPKKKSTQKSRSTAKKTR